jgi:hypothetical protein
MVFGGGGAPVSRSELKISVHSSKGRLPLFLGIKVNRLQGESSSFSKESNRRSGHTLSKAFQSLKIDAAIAEGDSRFLLADSEPMFSAASGSHPSDCVQQSCWTRVFDLGHAER